MEPRIELPQDLIDRLAAVRLDDAHLQYNYRQALREDPSLTDALFIERLTSDLVALEHNKVEYEAEQAKQRQIDEAHQRQSNRIALAGMALPALISAASADKNIREIACAALAHADAVLDAADATKDPILNA